MGTYGIKKKEYLAYRKWTVKEAGCYKSGRQLIPKIHKELKN